MRDFGHATPGTMTPFCVINTRKNGLQITSLAAYACEPNKKRGNTKTTIRCEKVISDPHLMIEMFQEIKRIFFFQRCQLYTQEYVRTRTLCDSAVVVNERFPIHRREKCF